MVIKFINMGLRCMTLCFFVAAVTLMLKYPACNLILKLGTTTSLYFIHNPTAKRFYPITKTQNKQLYMYL